MNDNYNWSASIGRWMGVKVSLHVLLFLFVAAIFCVQYQHLDALTKDMRGTALVTCFVVLLSVAFHEIAHVYALINLGGAVRKVVLTPWGGNSDFEMPQEPLAKLIIRLAGPFASATTFLGASILLIQSGHNNVVGLMNPFHPHVYLFSNSAISMLEIVAWTNFQLLMVNLLPCFPFDGAQLVRSVLELLRLDDSKLRSESAIMVIGNGCALGVVGMAWLLYGQKAGPIEPIWFIMLAAGIALYFSSGYSFHRETTNLKEEVSQHDSDWDFDLFTHEASFFGIPNDSNYLYEDHMTALGDDDTTHSQWMQEKQRSRDQLEQEREIQEANQADQILEKLHSGGISSLSDEEQDVLNRVSRRLRKRRETENTQVQSD